MSTQYPVDQKTVAGALIDEARYLAMYARSVSDPDGFWAEQAEEFLHWYSPWQNVSAANFHTGEVRWFEGATLNASYTTRSRSCVRTISTSTSCTA